MAHLECSVVSDFLVKLSNGTKEVSTQEWLLNFGLVEKIYQLFSKGTKERRNIFIDLWNDGIEWKGRGWQPTVNGMSTNSEW